MKEGASESLIHNLRIIVQIKFKSLINDMEMSTGEVNINLNGF